MDAFSNAKLTGMYEYLRQIRNTTPPDDVVMLVDGHDTLFQLPSDHVLKRYHEIGRKAELWNDLILTGADKGKLHIGTVTRDADPGRGK